MAKRELAFEDVISFLETLPYSKFKQVVDRYSRATGNNLSGDMASLVTMDFERRLDRLNINCACPKCAGTDNIQKYGRRNHVQVYKCMDCGSKFTRFSGTILEKTRWHWDIWIKVLEMTLNQYPIRDMVRVLVYDYGCTGIDIKTVWMWRMKLIHALAALPMPQLTGIVQVDETFIRESQKASRRLVSPLGKNVDREPRYGRQPSTLGVMGPEFATVVTAIDNRGYCVCKVSSLGKLTNEMFVDLFDEHLDCLAFLCSDANTVYQRYCQLRNIPHYEKPSNYLTVLNNNGYVQPSKVNPATAAVTMANNKKILEKLYLFDGIDQITNRGDIPYPEFEELKEDNALSLARVNELHNEIKKYIYGAMTNVSTKYLQDYIGFFTYVHNWRVSHGHAPASHKDAEDIFIEILKGKVNYTVTEVKTKILTLPKPTGRYVQLLKEETHAARLATANKYFKFNTEDGVKEFNKREYLLDLPAYKLYKIAKECGFTRYKKLAHWSLVSKILKEPNINEIMYKLLAEDRGYEMDEEDLVALRERAYRRA